MSTWVTRSHPEHLQISEDEARERASFIASRKALVPYLIPHRFEGDKKPQDLIRSKYGYGLGLNKSYLGDIFGHLRGAPTLYQWGAMEETGTDVSGAETPPKPGAPAGGLALTLWEDATRNNTTWRNFFLRKVLEWMLSSPGGFVLVDFPVTESGKQTTDAEAKKKAIRPYCQFVPWSMVEDWGRWELGFQYIKIVTDMEVRDPKEEPTAGDKRVRVLYQLDTETGKTTVSKHTPDGERIGEDAVIGPFVDKQGQFTLPFIDVAYGEREGLDYVGEGLIHDLADIILDLFNIWSETREGFRDAAFSIYAYRGERGPKIQELMESGSRYFDLGDNENAELTKVAGNVEEVDKGLAMMEKGVEAWETAARSNAATAQARARAMSGIALQAEFQLDLAPLLTEIAGILDSIETDTMFLCGQLGEFTADQIENVGVFRATDFRPEEEAARITRMAKDFAQTGIPLPPEAQVQLFMQWAESVDTFDLDGEITTADGGTITRRELFREQIETAVLEAATARRNEAAFVLGAPGLETPEEELEEI